MGRGNFEWGEGASHCKIYGHCETAEPIEMPFGLWTPMGPRNHVLHGSPQVLRDVAMATSFWTKIDINCSRPGAGYGICSVLVPDVA